MFVKICGLREAEHVATAVAAGADAVGFVLTPSPRRITPDRAAELAAEVPEEVLTVGVFAGQPVEEVRRLAEDSGVRAIQLHGAYPAEAFAALADRPGTLIRAVGADTTQPLDTGAFGEDLLLVDAPRPGSGEPWDPAGLPARPSGRWMLAGGLYPDTVAGAIGAARPWGVDVSSGVEISRGVKDSAAIRRFVAAARSAATL